MRFGSICGTIFIAGFALAGCAHEETPAATASSEAPLAAPAEDEASVSLAEHHRHHHHGGVTHFIAMSLDTLGADPAKKDQVEKIQEDLHASMAPAREAGKGLLLALANGIAAGNIDTARVEAAEAQVTSAASAAHEASLDALNRLHAVLSPAERAALVDKVRAHWEVWQKVNHQAEPGGREKGGRLAQLTEELSLTPDQVEKISAALKPAIGGLPKFDPAEAQAHIEAFASAFASDTFDAKSLTTGASTNGHLAAHGAARMATFYETVTPFLTPEQRTRLAANLREHLTHQAAKAEK